MIKLIIFDLDGTLIETRDMHYAALNKALVFYGFDEITYKDHIHKFNGLSTLTKLKLLNIPEDKHESINQKKQEYTTEELVKITPDQNITNILSKIKNMGIKICIASNSVRNTVALVIKQLGISEYIDYYLANEDVGCQKPNAEIFFKCLSKFNVRPQEAVIVEDSLIGIYSAIQSGCHIFPVSGPSDISLDIIKNTKSPKKFTTKLSTNYIFINKFINKNKKNDFYFLCI